MRVEDYPPQEPLSEVARKYQDECLRRRTAEGEDFQVGADPYQSVAVFRAPRPNGALLAFIHGGGWTNGYKEWMSFMAPAFTAAGVTFATLGYRLAPNHVFPAGLEDLADAIAWLHGRAAGFGADPRKLYLGGHSAGGHYAALLGVRRDWQEKRGLPGDVLRGVLPISGTYYFTEGSGLSMRPRFLGPAENGADVAASPIHALDGGTLPPFLLAHGTKDFPHLSRQTQEFEQALRAQGTAVERVELEGRDHFGASYAGGEADGPWVPHALRFMGVR